MTQYPPPLTIVPVDDDQCIKVVVTLANEIWNEHYPSIIGISQIQYMLKTFQSQDALTHQIRNDNFYYYLLQIEMENIGYIGIVPDENKKELFLSKIYLKASQRNKGYGRQAINFIENFAKQRQLDKITLMVSKKNTRSIQAYADMGFQNMGPIIKDIGHGFQIDDYIMEKPVK